MPKIGDNLHYTHARVSYPMYGSCGMVHKILRYEDATCYI